MSDPSHQQVHFGCPHCGCHLTLPPDSGPMEGPCPRCAKPIRAQGSAAVSRPFQAGPTASMERPVARPDSPLGQPLYCRCPTCGHRHGFDPMYMGQVATCSGCHTLIRLPEKPQPEVPIQTPPTKSANGVFQPPGHDDAPVPVVHPSLEVPPHPGIPAHLQAGYAEMVKALHDYEHAGIPADHPDRLHLLEMFFKAFAPEPSPQIGQPAVESHASPSLQRSHLPPRRDRLPVESSPRILPSIQPEGAMMAPRTLRPQAEPSPFQAQRESRIDALRSKAAPSQGARLLSRRPGAEEFPFSHNRRRLTGFQKLALLSLVVLGGLGAAYVVRGAYETKDRPAVEREPETISRETSPAPPPLTSTEQSEIKDLVRDFHYANTPEAKATLVADGVMLLSRMEDYYAAHGLEPEEVTIDPYLTQVENGEMDYFRGSGSYASGQPLEFYAVRRSGEFLLDWPSMVGYSEADWASFVAEKSPIPAAFRVIATRVDNGAGDSSQMVLSLRTPLADERLLAYAETPSSVSESLSRLFEVYGASPAKLTVNLAYVSLPGSEPKLMITEMVRPDWLSVGEPM